MLVKHEAGTLTFTPNCPIDVLNSQIYYMREYLTQLEVRAELEGIDLFRYTKITMGDEA